MLGLFIQGILAQASSSTAGTIGVRVTLDSAGRVILSPISGQKAEKSGLQPGTVLLAIEQDRKFLEPL